MTGTDVADTSVTSAGTTTGTVSAAEAGTVPGTGQQAAIAFLARFREAVAGQQVLVLPYSDPDSVAMIRAGLSTHLAALIKGTRTTAARIVAGIAAPAGAVTPNLITDISWPATGAVNDATLAFLSAQGMSQALLSPTSLKHQGGAVGSVTVDETADSGRQVTRRGDRRAGAAPGFRSDQTRQQRRGGGPGEQPGRGADCGQHRRHRHAPCDRSGQALVGQHRRPSTAVRTAPHPAEWRGVRRSSALRHRRRRQGAGDGELSSGRPTGRTRSGLPGRRAADDRLDRGECDRHWPNRPAIAQPTRRTS